MHAEQHNFGVILYPGELDRGWVTHPSTNWARHRATSLIETMR